MVANPEPVREDDQTADVHFPSEFHPYPFAPGLRRCRKPLCVEVAVDGEAKSIGHGRGSHQAFGERHPHQRRFVDRQLRRRGFESPRNGVVEPPARVPISRRPGDRVDEPLRIRPAELRLAQEKRRVHHHAPDADCPQTG